MVVGDPGRAEREYRAELELFPAHYQAWANLGILLVQIGRPAEAERFLVEHLAAAPGQLRVFGRQQWTAPVASGSNPPESMPSNWESPPRKEKSMPSEKCGPSSAQPSLRAAPAERMAILELRAMRGWSKAETARRFFVTDDTIRTWLRRADDDSHS